MATLEPAFRPWELDALARRDATLARKYGESRLAHVFEQQLFLLMQSFGLHVVPGDPGQRLVDLLCIADRAVEPLTFLVEAKTSGRAYDLPSDDQRSLLEYIRFSRSLRVFPELRFVLIVGPRASTSLSAKLATFESEAGVPLRFCTAQELSELRDSFSGSMPVDTFRVAVVAGAHVLPAGFTKPVIAQYWREQAALSELIKAFNRPGMRVALVSRSDLETDVEERPPVQFAHVSERQFAELLDFYQIEWQYEPTSFDLYWDEDGAVTERFTPDFYLPAHDLFIEITTLNQKLVTKKNRKVRRLRELHPDIRCKIFYQRDYLSLVMRGGLLGGGSRSP